MQVQAGCGSLRHSNAVRPFSTSLACTSELGVDFLLFRRRSRRFHIPRMQKRAGGVCLQGFDSFAPPPPPLHARMSGGGFLWHFNTVRTLSTFLACNNELEVDFARFQPVRAFLHLPCVQMQAGGGFCRVSTLFAPSPPPSRARASGRWILVGFRLVLASSTPSE